MTMPNSALQKTRRKVSASAKVEEYIRNVLYTAAWRLVRELLKENWRENWV